MNWAGKQHPVDTAVEWLAPVPLALAASWAGERFGWSLIGSVAVGIAIFAAGFAAVRIGGRDQSQPSGGFEPTEFVPVVDELLLEEKDSVLELSDRLDEVEPDSRVVRLFARQEPTPGELVDRIVDFLADGRRADVSSSVTAEPGRIPDASAALHDALANIRASLR